MSAVQSGVIAVGRHDDRRAGHAVVERAASTLSTGVANRSRTPACRPMRRSRSTRRHGEQRVAAEVEEVIVSADALEAEQLAPDGRRVRFRFAPAVLR